MVPMGETGLLPALSHPDSMLLHFVDALLQSVTGHPRTRNRRRQHATNKPALSRAAGSTNISHTRGVAVLRGFARRRTEAGSICGTELDTTVGHLGLSPFSISTRRRLCHRLCGYHSVWWQQSGGPRWTT